MVVVCINSRRIKQLCTKKVIFRKWGGKREYLSHIRKGKDLLNTKQLEKPKEEKRLDPGQYTNVKNSVNKKQVKLKRKITRTYLQKSNKKLMCFPYKDITIQKE